MPPNPLENSCFGTRNPSQNCLDPPLLLPFALLKIACQSRLHTVWYLYRGLVGVRCQTTKLLRVEARKRVSNGVGFTRNMSRRYPELNLADKRKSSRIRCIILSSLDEPERRIQTTLWLSHRNSMRWRHHIGPQRWQANTIG